MLLIGRDGPTACHTNPRERGDYRPCRPSRLRRRTHWRVSARMSGSSRRCTSVTSPTHRASIRPGTTSSPTTDRHRARAPRAAPNRRTSRPPPRSRTVSRRAAATVAQPSAPAKPATASKPAAAQAAPAKPAAPATKADPGESRSGEGRSGEGRSGQAGRQGRRAECRRPADHAVAGRRREDRPEHGRLAERAHRDQRPRGPGQAAGGQPHRDQQPPRPRAGRQGQLHPPGRLRDGPRAGRSTRR